MVSVPNAPIETSPLFSSVNEIKRGASHNSILLRLRTCHSSRCLRDLCSLCPPIYSRRRLLDIIVVLSSREHRSPLPGSSLDRSFVVGKLIYSEVVSPRHRGAGRPGGDRRDGGLRGELCGDRAGVLVDGVPADAGADAEAVVRVLQPRRVHHARRHRRLHGLPLRRRLVLPRLPAQRPLLAAPDEAPGCDAVVHDLRRRVLPPQRRRAARQHGAPPRQHRRHRRRARVPEVRDGDDGLHVHHRDLQPAAAPQGDAQGDRHQGHRPQPPRRYSVCGDLLGGTDGWWAVPHLCHLDDRLSHPHQGDGGGFATGERLLVLEDHEDGPLQAREEEAGG